MKIYIFYELEKRIKYSFLKSFTPENKDRVPFYMSILTRMKFIVRGKSVDFKNREGSSPSIPKIFFYFPSKSFFSLTV